MNIKISFAFLALCLMTSVAMAATDSASVSAALGVAPAAQTIDLPPGTRIGAVRNCGNWCATCPAGFAVEIQEHMDGKMGTRIWMCRKL